MKVSIIIPCYNGSEYIENCIHSICQDKIKEKEIIFINDGSKDNSLEILQRFAKKQKNIIVLDQENSGQGAARNKALQKASGEYVFFLDVDDFVAEDTFYKMYHFAIKNHYDYVYCDYFEHRFSGDVLVKNHHTEDVKKDAVLANFAPWGKLISRKLINEIDFHFLEGHIFEDVAVIPHLAASSKNPGYFEEALYYYNMVNQSTTRKKSYDKKYEDMILVSDYMYDLFQKDKLVDFYYEELKYIYLDSILKSGVLKFAKYKEGVKQIPILRKNVQAKFNNLLDNSYYKAEPFYRKLTAFIALKFPPRLIRFLKLIKN